MLENRDDPRTEAAPPAGVDDEDEAEEQEGDESGPVEALWVTGGFFRPWRITTNVSKPRAAFTTSCEVKSISLSRKNKKHLEAGNYNKRGFKTK